MVKFRAWHKTWEEMGKVKRIRFDDEGNITTVLVKGQAFGSNVHLEEIELMQSTGLKDENSKEIFEGDILEVTDKHSWLEVVSYSQEKVMFVTEEINREFKVPESPLYDLSDSTFLKFKVIGNIYENSELLEVEG
ncbi:YopX family protein [Streptococcus koreensis]|uniref:YopX family protein n=1 Tax=Streptococcus koreensis TaxID=2382163 RepID=UPI003CEBAAB5